MESFLVKTTGKEMFIHKNLEAVQVHYTAAAVIHALTFRCHLNVVLKLLKCAIRR